MFKTIEAHVRKQVAPAALRAEFRQHEFETMRPFCLLVFCVSILIWLVFDLIVSFLGGQGFTWLSFLFITLLGCQTVVLRFTRRSHHFNVLNLLFVATITLGMRLVIEGIPLALRPVWLVLGVSTVLYAVSVLPVRRWSFFCAMVITWPAMRLPGWAARNSRSFSRGWTNTLPSSKWRRCANGCARTLASTR